MSADEEALTFEVWRTIHQTQGRIKRYEDHVLAGTGLTSEQYWVLRAIKELPKPVNITELSHWLERSTNSISMIVERMVKAHLLKRLRSDKDRRVVYVKPTDRAVTFFVAADEIRKDLASKVLLGIISSELRALVTLLNKIKL